MKTCTKCKKSKSLSEYHKDPKGKFNRSAQCKDCKNKAKSQRSKAPTSNETKKKDKPLPEQSNKVKIAKEYDFSIFNYLLGELGGFYTISVSKNGTEIRKHGNPKVFYKGKTPQEALSLIKAS